MDIRNYFPGIGGQGASQQPQQPQQSSTKKATDKKSAAADKKGKSRGAAIAVPKPHASQPTGLTWERNLSPQPKQTRKDELSKKRPPPVALFGEDEGEESDGESPMPKSLRSAVRSSARISSDEEDFPASASMAMQDSPVKQTTTARSKGAATKVLGEPPAKKVKLAAAPMTKKAVEQAPPQKVSPPKFVPAPPKKAVAVKQSSKKSKAKKVLAATETRDARSKSKELSASPPPPPQQKESPVVIASESQSPPGKSTKSKKTTKGTSASPEPAKERKKLPEHRPAPQPVIIEKPAPILPWVDKYKPAKLAQLQGLQGDASPMHKLLDWLRRWHQYNADGGANKRKASCNTKDGSGCKAALLSGPPGIGKTTCAVLCCQELGLRYREMNASDARSKKSIEKASGALDNAVMDNWMTRPTAVAGSQVQGVDHVLIMDEVDGMSGNADRMGIAELILMIKRTRVPIICICNDRQAQKIRSLANHCFDLRVTRPRVPAIKACLLSIAAKEGLKPNRDVVDSIIEASNHDIRQCINALQMTAAGNVGGRLEDKDVSVNIFEAARVMLSNKSSLMEKQEMFFADYSIMPLFVHENYLHVKDKNAGKLEQLNRIRRASESISFGDIVSQQIRSENDWRLLVDQAMFSCAVPALILDGHMQGMLQFPGWLGKFSNANKRHRLMRQLAAHAQKTISGGNHALVEDYLPVLRDRIYRPLAEKEAAGVNEALGVYKAYNLVRDDNDAINELCVWPGRKDIAKSVNAKTKAALTRAINKEKQLVPYATGFKSSTSKKLPKGTPPPDEEGGDGDDDADEPGPTPEDTIEPDEILF